MAERESSTLEAILQAAKAEFLEKGYQKASLRSIAGAAGVTTGAFYGYFQSKEALFDALAGAQYWGLLHLYCTILSSFLEKPPQEQKEHMKLYTEMTIRQLTDYVYRNRDAFKLILCCSEGTPYSNLVHELSGMEEKATHAFTRNSQETETPAKEVGIDLEHILTSGMFSAYFEIIIHDIPRREAEGYIHQLLEFYYAGWRKIMGL